MKAQGQVPRGSRVGSTYSSSRMSSAEVRSEVIVPRAHRMTSHPEVHTAHQGTLAVPSDRLVATPGSVTIAGGDPFESCTGSPFLSPTPPRASSGKQFVEDTQGSLALAIVDFAGADTKRGGGQLTASPAVSEETMLKESLAMVQDSVSDMRQGLCETVSQLQRSVADLYQRVNATESDLQNVHHQIQTGQDQTLARLTDVSESVVAFQTAFGGCREEIQETKRDLELTKLALAQTKHTVDGTKQDVEQAVAAICRPFKDQIDELMNCQKHVTISMKKAQSDTTLVEELARDGRERLDRVEAQLKGLHGVIRETANDIILVRQIQEQSTKPQAAAQQQPGVDTRSSRAVMASPEPSDIDFPHGSPGIRLRSDAESGTTAQQQAETLTVPQVVNNMLVSPHARHRDPSPRRAVSPSPLRSPGSSGDFRVPMDLGSPRVTPSNGYRTCISVPVSLQQQQPGAQLQPQVQTQGQPSTQFVHVPAEGDRSPRVPQRVVSAQQQPSWANTPQQSPPKPSPRQLLQVGAGSASSAPSQAQVARPSASTPTRWMTVPAGGHRRVALARPSSPRPQPLVPASVAHAGVVLPMESPPSTSRNTQSATLMSQQQPQNQPHHHQQEPQPPQAVLPGALGANLGSPPPQPAEAESRFPEGVQASQQSLNAESGEAASIAAAIHAAAWQGIVSPGAESLSMQGAAAAAAAAAAA
eukprot:gnl/TRDRNA2_/TRDRNA2_191151_c0_seq1.p1 gnl/TRDRNA2_/TRDRNA2_191151_c0~~gnl/TRDRNA2_/TRDRNA2_191151_c0_seq1.p1  ORF type:complete len:701 (-),score=109.06 gnl/TRDRNA2_/TRDRNA2_191151_c0_seq1:43-2145(-)